MPSVSCRYIILLLCRYLFNTFGDIFGYDKQAGFLLLIITYFFMISVNCNSKRKGINRFSFNFFHKPVFPSSIEKSSPKTWHIPKRRGRKIQKKKVCLSVEIKFCRKKNRNNLTSRILDKRTL